MLPSLQAFIQANWSGPFCRAANGRDLRKVPLRRRKSELKKAITATAVQFNESFEIEGREMFEHACKIGPDGVVSEVRDSVYPIGRSNNWVKKACAQRETLTIAGFAPDEGKWDGMYLGRRKGTELIYARKVDHGFDKTSAAELRRRLEPLVRKTQPYAKRIAPTARPTARNVWDRTEVALENRNWRRAIPNDTARRPPTGALSITLTTARTLSRSFCSLDPAVFESAANARKPPGACGPAVRQPHQPWHLR